MVEEKEEAERRARKEKDETRSISRHVNSPLKKRLKAASIYLSFPIFLSFSLILMLSTFLRSPSYLLVAVGPFASSLFSRARARYHN